MIRVENAKHKRPGPRFARPHAFGGHARVAIACALLTPFIASGETNAQPAAAQVDQPAVVDEGAKPVEAPAADATPAVPAPVPATST